MVDYYNLRRDETAELITRLMKTHHMTFFDLMRADSSLQQIRGFDHHDSEDPAI